MTLLRNSLFIISCLLLLTTSSGATISFSSNSNPDHHHSEGCKRMTGALGFGEDDYYLFFGHDYVRLDAHFRQWEAGDAYDSFGTPYPEAAFILSIDRYVYVFSRKNVFSIRNRFAPDDAANFAGPSHRDFFKDGLDASGNLSGTTIFFKGCAYVALLGWYPSAPTRLPESIPCHPDAAMTVGRDLWVFKDDKMWRVTTKYVSSPVEISSVITLDDITLCKEGELEGV